MRSFFHPKTMIGLFCKVLLWLLFLVVFFCLFVGIFTNYISDAGVWNIMVTVFLLAIGGVIWMFVWYLRYKVKGKA